MGIGGISLWQLLIILLIVVMLFGTKRLRNMGGDIGSAVKGFKKAMNTEDEKALTDESRPSKAGQDNVASQKHS